MQVKISNLGYTLFNFEITDKKNFKPTTHGSFLSNNFVNSLSCVILDYRSTCVKYKYSLMQTCAGM